MHEQTVVLTTHIETSADWRTSLWTHVREHRVAAFGLGLALLGVLALLVQSMWQLAYVELGPGMRYAMLGGAAGLGATALGALPALGLHSVPQKLEDSLLGFAAGMMLAASAFSLLLPGLEAGGALLGSKPLGAAVVVLGMALGGVADVGPGRVHAP